MTYYKDFTVCTYFDGEDWLCRLIAVGWIEKHKPFPKGATTPDLVPRIVALREAFCQSSFMDSISFRGLHGCSICAPPGEFGEPLLRSHVNLFIPHRGFVFLAPGRIDHYIEQHRYQPPDSFVESVFACPSPLSAEYREALRASNRGVDAPWFEKRRS